MTKTVDVHNHLYPLEYLEYLEKRTQYPNMERIGPKLWSFSAKGVVISKIYRAGHYDPEARIQDMDKYGIDVQILSMTLPGVELLPVKEGVLQAKKANDYYAELCRKYNGRFFACATLPFQDIDESVKELDRAYRELGMKGIVTFSNINGKPLFSPEFFPIYARAEQYGLPILIHPAVPHTLETMKMYGIPPGIFGYTLDTSLAVVGLIWHGVLEKFPGLKIVHSHLGGVVPYLVQRMENSWQFFSKDLKYELKKSASEYYQEQVYPDSISSYPPALKCCLDFVGPEHILLGTDYAHGPGIIEQAVADVKGMGLSPEDTDSILGGNAARIFHLW